MLNKQFDSKKFSNALCGRPPDYKTWQEYHKEGNLDGVLKVWKELAREELEIENGRRFWSIIIEVINDNKNN